MPPKKKLVFGVNMSAKAVQDRKDRLSQDALKASGKSKRPEPTPAANGSNAKRGGPPRSNGASAASAPRGEEPEDDPSARRGEEDDDEGGHPRKAPKTSGKSKRDQAAATSAVGGDETEDDEEEEEEEEEEQEEEEEEEGGRVRERAAQEGDELPDGEGGGRSHGRQGKITGAEDDMTPVARVLMVQRLDEMIRHSRHQAGVVDPEGTEANMSAAWARKVESTRLADRAIPLAAFARVLRDVLGDVAGPNQVFHMQKALVYTMENLWHFYIVDLFHECAMLAEHCKRVTIFPKDMALALRIRGYDDLGRGLDFLPNVFDKQCPGYDEIRGSQAPAPVRKKQKKDSDAQEAEEGFVRKKQRKDSDAQPSGGPSNKGKGPASQFAHRAVQPQGGQRAPPGELANPDLTPGQLGYGYRYPPGQPAPPSAPYTGP